MAAGNIKGITIEIGGETTKLSKALSDVNSTSGSLQKELKEVDKLLKLDPTNTELLAQKQQLLKEAIGNTKDKLDTLKEAESKYRNSSKMAKYQKNSIEDYKEKLLQQKFS